MDYSDASADLFDSSRSIRRPNEHWLSNNGFFRGNSNWNAGGSGSAIPETEVRVQRISAAEVTQLTSPKDKSGYTVERTPDTSIQQIPSLTLTSPKKRHWKQQVSKKSMGGKKPRNAIPPRVLRKSNSASLDSSLLGGDSDLDQSSDCPKQFTTKKPCDKKGQKGPKVKISAKSRTSKTSTDEDSDWDDFKGNIRKSTPKNILKKGKSGSTAKKGQKKSVSYEDDGKEESTSAPKSSRKRGRPKKKVVAQTKTPVKSVSPNKVAQDASNVPEFGPGDWMDVRVPRPQLETHYMEK